MPIVVVLLGCLAAGRYKFESRGLNHKTLWRNLQVNLPGNLDKLVCSHNINLNKEKISLEQASLIRTFIIYGSIKLYSTGPRTKSHEKAGTEIDYHFFEVIYDTLHHNELSWMVIELSEWLVKNLMVHTKSQ